VLSRDKLTERKLSRAALETLAIIAYHQPVTRAEIEEIRGVQLSKGTLDVLFDQGWIRPKGRRQTPGRPVTWGTTDTFLDHFGLESLAELPGVDELKTAGLLDARPAIQIYGVVSDADAEADERGAEDEDEGEDAPGEFGHQ
jgi:segregation and condensation protein B